MTTHYRQLTQGQRYQIEAGLSAAESQASIAKRVGVHPSTISREVRRNSTQNIYKAVSAAHESDARRAGARKFCKPATWLSHHPVLFMRALKVTHFRQLDDPLTVFGLGGTIFGSVFTLSA